MEASISARDDGIVAKKLIVVLPALISSFQHRLD